MPLGIESAVHVEVDVAEPDMLAETEFVCRLPPRIHEFCRSNRTT